MNTLTKMLREVYGITEGITEAPPRPAMKRFGGTFDPGTLQRATCRILQPPFVSYCMIVEERVDSGATQQLPPSAAEMEVEDADGLRRTSSSRALRFLSTNSRCRASRDGARTQTFRGGRGRVGRGCEAYACCRSHVQVFQIIFTCITESIFS